MRNYASGAGVNLAVDGLNGGSIHDNSYRDHQGDRVLDCHTSSDYTVGHTINVSRLQPGYLVRTYDAGTMCQ